MSAPINPGCPAGGTWYACDAEPAPNQFIGCCRIDACANGGACPEAELAPASFSPASEGTFADQNCTLGGGGGAAAAPRASFYTCALTSPTFLGCCRSDPCAQGACPARDLAAALLAPGRDAAWGFLARLGNGTVEAVSISEVVPSESTSSPTSTSTSTSTSASTSTSVPAAVTAAPGRWLAPPVAAVAVPAIGGVVGAIVMFLLCISAAYCVRRRRARREKRGERTAAKGRIGRPSEPALASPMAVEACANDKYSVSGPTTRDSQASTVAQRPGKLWSPRSRVINSLTWEDGSVYVPWRGSSHTALVSPLMVDEARPASLGFEPPFTANGASEVAAEPVGIVELPAEP
jgi:hypothetical protein